MSKPLPPMWTDPNESQLVRDLLQAGRKAGAEGYDVQSGLLQHMAHIKAGTPAPSWSTQTMTSAAGSAGAGVSLPLWGVLAVSVMGAAAGAVLWSDALMSPKTPVVPRPATQVEEHIAEPQSALPPTPKVVEPAAEALVPPAPEPKHAVRPRASATHHSQRATPSDRTISPSVSSQTGPQRNQGMAPSSASGFVAVPSTQNAKTGSAAGATRPSLDEVVTRAVQATEASSREAAVAPQPKAAVKPEPSPSAREELLEREMRMLKVAQAVLDSDPARSLRLVEMGEREFAGSIFTQERQYVHIVALARLGRNDEAHRMAAAYLSTYPSGPFSERVRQALGR